MSPNNFTILLSASVPSKKRSEKYQEDYTKIKDAQIQIDEAVIGLSRNIFQAGGKLIFGGHPSISSLIAMVAAEFKINKDIEDLVRNEQSEKPIKIFQSKAFLEVLVPTIFNTEYFSIKFTDTKNGEKYDPTITDEQCKMSLKFMREEMMKENIDALVCIGGMEGIEREFELFREAHPSKLVFILKSTGGASKILADNFSNSKNVIIIDDYLDFPNEEGKMKNEKNSEKFDIIPYAFLTALIIEKIQQR